MEIINSDGQIVDAKCTADKGGSASRAEANYYGASDGFLWANTAMSAASLIAALTALALVLFKLNFYADQIALEKRLNTQAIDEVRVEMNVTRKLAGLPPVDYKEHN